MDRAPFLLNVYSRILAPQRCAYVHVWLFAVFRREHSSINHFPRVVAPLLFCVAILVFHALLEEFLRLGIRLVY